MLREIVLSCAVTCVCTPLEALAQAQTLPPLAVAAQLNPSYQHVHTLYPSELGSNEVRIYQLDPKKSSYHYIPYVYIDWREYAKNMDLKECSGKNATSDSLVSIRISAEFYWPQLLAEISNGISELTSSPIRDIHISMPPNAGIVVYVYGTGEDPIESINTLPLPNLLRGTAMTPLGNQPAMLTGSVVATCAKHREIANKREATTLMFSAGVVASVDKSEASATLALNSSILADLKSQESKIDRTTIEGKGGSRGVSIKIGGFSAGGGALQDKPPLRRSSGVSSTASGSMTSSVAKV